MSIWMASSGPLGNVLVKQAITVLLPLIYLVILLAVNFWVMPDIRVTTPDQLLTDHRHCIRDDDQGRANQEAGPGADGDTSAP